MWCFVGYVAAKQTHVKHMAHVEIMSVAMEAVIFELDFECMKSRLQTNIYVVVCTNL